MEWTELICQSNYNRSTKFMFKLQKKLLHTHLSDISDYITDNAPPTSNLLRISVEEDIFFLSLLIFFQYESTWFFFMSNHFITDHIVPHDLYKTQDSISKDFNISRVVTYLYFLQSSDIILVTKYLYLKHLDTL